MPAKTRIGSVEIGPTPCVVGVASRVDTLTNIAATAPVCDVMEVRGDLIGPEADTWLRSVPATLDKRAPALLTIRSAREGGRWTGAEGERIQRYSSLLPFVEAVDVELESEAFPHVVAATKKAGRVVVGSFHDFASTPDDTRLRALVERGVNGGADIIKIAVWTVAESDVLRLGALLRVETPVPLAVMGMGPLGIASRLRLAASGSCLVYGFLDEESAPGQLSSAELVKRLAETLPHYRELRSR